MRLPFCRAEIIASSVDGTVRRFDVRMGLHGRGPAGGARHRHGPVA